MTLVEDAWTAAYRREYEGLVNGVGKVAESNWRTMVTIEGAWDDQVAAWLDATTPTLHAAQMTSAELTDAYLARVLSDILDDPTGPIGLDPADYVTEALRGRPDGEVYRRALWEQRAARIADPTTDVINIGADRVSATAQQNVAMAARKATNTVLAKSKAPGYRRVLGAGKNCPLCIAASTRIYSSSDLMPIHPRCKCTAIPVNTLPDAPISGTADFTVVEHGEMGPLLMGPAHPYQH